MSSSVPFPPSLPVAGTERRPAAFPTYCFAVSAAADPGILPRVMALFAKRGLVPRRWHSDVICPAPGGFAGGGRDELVIDIQVDGLAPEEGDYIAAWLRQQVAVHSVLTSVKSRSQPSSQVA